ncbi:MAG: hypothetical protein ACK583_07130 [Cyanobacteriota bacterium]
MRMARCCWRRWRENSPLAGDQQVQWLPQLRAHPAGPPQCALTRYFWTNLKVSGHELQISLGLEMEGAVVPVTMVFRHHVSRGSGSESVRR